MINTTHTRHNVNTGAAYSSENYPLREDSPVGIILGFARTVSFTTDSGTTETYTRTVTVPDRD